MDRAKLLVSRQGKRMAALDDEAQFSARVPLVKGGTLIVAADLLRHLNGEKPDASVDVKASKRVEQLAMEAVFATERALERTPVDTSGERGIGFDIESSAANASMGFIQLRDRLENTVSVILTYKELNCGNNQPEKSRLAISRMSGNRASPARYVSRTDYSRLRFASTGSNFPLSDLFSVA